MAYLGLSRNSLGQIVSHSTPHSDLQHFHGIITHEACQRFIEESVTKALNPARQSAVGEPIFFFTATFWKTVLTLIGGRSFSTIDTMAESCRCKVKQSSTYLFQFLEHLRTRGWTSDQLNQLFHISTNPQGSLGHSLRLNHGPLPLGITSEANCYRRFHELRPGDLNRMRTVSEGMFIQHFEACVEHAQTVIPPQRREFQILSTYTITNPGEGLLKEANVSLTHLSQILPTTRFLMVPHFAAQENSEHFHVVIFVADLTNRTIRVYDPQYDNLANVLTPYMPQASALKKWLEVKYPSTPFLLVTKGIKFIQQFPYENDCAIFAAAFLEEVVVQGRINPQTPPIGVGSHREDWIRSRREQMFCVASGNPTLMRLG